MGLTELAEISRAYGSDKRFVLAGGGNTSFKDDEYLYIKASGFSLATITESGFAKMVRSDLDRIWDKEYPSDTDERERVALKDLMDSRASGEDKRPSVETLLHEAIPDAYVVHTHPALVNGVTCSQQGRKAAEELFGDDVLWVPIVNPGYVLAVTVKHAMEDFQKVHGRPPSIILLQNHGVFVSGRNTDSIRRTYEETFAKIGAEVQDAPELTEAKVDRDRVNVVESALRRSLLHGGGGFGGSAATDATLVIRHAANTEVLRMLDSRRQFEAVSSAYTPDHIVYCGVEPLYLADSSNVAEQLHGELTYYREKHGRDPKVVAVRDLGVFGCGIGEKAADNAVALFLDAVKIAVYARSFGGHQFLPSDQIDFLKNWEVEQYRSNVNTE